MIITEVVKNKSKKTGNVYYALKVTLPNGYEKLVFLDKAEEFMVMGLYEYENCDERG